MSEVRHVSPSLSELARQAVLTANRAEAGLPCLPRPCTPEMFADALAKKRGRPVLWRPLQVSGPDLPCGLLLALDDRDLIYYPSEADPLLQDAVKWHEIAHLVRGDEGGVDAATLKRMFPRMSPDLVDRMLRRYAALGRSGGYSDAQEQATEMCGRVLAERFSGTVRSDCFLRTLADAPPARCRGWWRW
jgi:hypothetical protein